MSTLSLADLGSKTRRTLGLEAMCHCAEAVAWVAVIPVIETVIRPEPNPANRELPGAAWLATGLHRLRVPHARFGSPRDPSATNPAQP